VDTEVENNGYLHKRASEPEKGQ
jgi:hypothetical protein